MQSITVPSILPTAQSPFVWHVPRGDEFVMMEKFSTFERFVAMSKICVRKAEKLMPL